MATFTPPAAITGPDAPDATPTTTETVGLPEKPSTPPAGVSADPAPAPEAPDTQPDLLAGKFKTQDDLVKAYKELEAKLGQKPADTKPDTPPAKTDEKPTGQLDLKPFEAEYVRDGKLSDASYEHLGKLGFKRSDVDQYIAGRTVVAERFAAEVTASVGGTEGYQQLITWAADNLSAPDILSFNQAVQSGDVGLAKMAVEGLSARYTAAEGKAPNLVAGSGRGSPGGYESVEQMKADMRDERYIRGDAAFHAMVDRKLRATKAF